MYCHSSIPAGSALLAPGQEWAYEGKEVISELSQPVCPVYEELLEVMDRATVRLDLQWRHEKGGVSRSRLDEQFLSGHNLPAPVSLPFLPDLHSEMMKAWDKPYSAHILRYKHGNYADIEGMHEHGYGVGVSYWRDPYELSLGWGDIDVEGSGPAIQATKRYISLEW